MKKFGIIFSVIMMLVVTACGRKSPLERLEGRWILEKEGTNIGVTIEPDGTGKIDVSSRDDDGKNRLLLREYGMITVDGDNLYINLDSGPQSHLYIVGDQLYSNDHVPFKKVK